MLMSISSYCQQPKHRRDLISAFEEAFSTVGKQGARGIFEETLRLERKKKKDNEPNGHRQQKVPFNAAELLQRSGCLTSGEVN